MKVMIACECSGVVRDAFRRLGHEAWSNDFETAEPEGEYSNYHLYGDCLSFLDRCPSGGGWDMMIAHPPCTYLCVSGIHWNSRTPGRDEKTEAALDLVRHLLSAPIPRIALENPVSIISTKIRKPDQIIQPWWFGDDASKKTCLWLKSLPLLRPANKLPGDNSTRRANQTASGQNKLGPSPTRAKERSRTYVGIANAMAEQWGGVM